MPLLDDDALLSSDLRSRHAEALPQLPQRGQQRLDR
jgi:hypothetical protein